MKPGWEWVLVLLIVLLLFGAKRLPDTARSLGRSMRILKAETKGLRDDDEEQGTSAADEHTTTAGTSTTAALPPAGSPVVQPGGAPDVTSRASTPAGQRTDDR